MARDDDHDEAMLEPLTRPSRRHWLRGALAFAAGSRWAFAHAAEEGAEREKLIVRSLHPLDLETPVSAFDRFLTPNDLFFVRTHFPEPAESRGPWTLEIGGLVTRNVRLSPADLQAMPQVSLPAVLQCSGNGRSNYAPRVPGVGWGRGAVGNAEWSGVRLADLLECAGLKKNVEHVHFLGADAPPNPRTPAYLRSLPLEKALDPHTLVATQMNGQPLPWLHGGPLRLVVPGWSGNHWMKWLRKIEASDVEAPGTYQQSGYRMPHTRGTRRRREAGRHAADHQDEREVALCATGRGGEAEARTPRGARRRLDRAGHVTRVDVAVGADGKWLPATLEGEPREYTWRLWRFAWNPEMPGRYTLRVRATDSSGATQPDKPPWNKSGYLWNGIDEVTCEIM